MNGAEFYDGETRVEMLDRGKVYKGLILFVAVLPTGKAVVLDSQGDCVTDDIHIGEVMMSIDLFEMLHNRNALCNCPLFKCKHFHRLLKKSMLLKSLRETGKGIDERSNTLIRAIRDAERRTLAKGRKDTSESEPLAKTEVPLSVAWEGLIQTLEKAGRDGNAANK